MSCPAPPGRARAFPLVLTAALLSLACSSKADPTGPTVTPVSITTSTLATGVEGVEYGPVSLAATGGDGSSYSWSLASGSGPLPAGLDLSTTGQISGTPTAPGNHGFTVRATSSGESAEKALTITVLPTLVLTPAALPGGTVGVPYGPETLVATGGTGSYAFALASGSGPLPTGLGLSAGGQISGTPTASGTADFTVEVTSGTQTTQAPLSITIQPAPTATGILFATYRDGNWEIYRMELDGSNPTNLTNNAANDLVPAPSPDGSRIAFWTNREGGFARIYAMDPDGSNQTFLTAGSTSNDLEPAWSFDGSQIAFTSNRNTSPVNEEIFVMDADGSNPTNLTNYPTANDHHPAWSPDGSRIAFASRRDGDWEVYVMGSDGSNPTNVTNLASVTDHEPKWSPDGSRIAFTSLRNPGGIYLMDPDGSNLEYLGPGWDPSWSPDGSRIAFVSARDGDNEIYVMDADGTNVVRLTFSPGDDSQPAWER